VRPDDSGSPNNLRPSAPVKYLRVGRAGRDQLMPLTFELYRAIRMLSDGLSAASLPREVVALIDATKARLSGFVVRDEEQLEGASIMIGNEGPSIAQVNGRFVVTEGANG